MWVVAIFGNEATFLLKFLLLSAIYLTQSHIFLAVCAQKYWKLFLTWFILFLRWVASAKTSTWLSPNEFTLVLRRSAFKFWLYCVKPFLFSHLTRNYLRKLMHSIKIHYFKVENLALRRILLLNYWIKPCRERRKWWLYCLKLYFINILGQKCTTIDLGFDYSKGILKIIFFCNYCINLGI